MAELALPVTVHTVSWKYGTDILYSCQSYKFIITLKTFATVFNLRMGVLGQYYIPDYYYYKPVARPMAESPDHVSRLLRLCLHCQIHVFP